VVVLGFEVRVLCLAVGALSLEPYPEPNKDIIFQFIAGS
jgi:hypothetical protein